jgi:hypothetical protein
VSTRTTVRASQKLRLQPRPLPQLMLRDELEELRRHLVGHPEELMPAHAGHRRYLTTTGQVEEAVATVLREAAVGGQGGAVAAPRLPADFYGWIDPPLDAADPGGAGRS